MNPSQMPPGTLIYTVPILLFIPNEQVTETPSNNITRTGARHILDGGQMEESMSIIHLTLSIKTTKRIVWGITIENLLPKPGTPKKLKQVSDGKYSRINNQTKSFLIF
jgi:hypothetical protein